MTSFISAPRRCFTRCSPRTQAMASATLLLPQPFGPTMLVIPSPVKMTLVWSAKDLKPVISRRFSLNIGIRRLMRGVTPKLASKYDLRVVHYKGTRATCQQELELSQFKSWQWLRLEAHLGGKRHPTFALFCRLGSAGRGSK